MVTNTPVLMSPDNLQTPVFMLQNGRCTRAYHCRAGLTRCATGCFFTDICKRGYWLLGLRQFYYLSYSLKRKIMQRFFYVCCMLCILEVATGQNVGIGTPAPAGRLQVNHRSSSAIGILLLDSASFSAGSMEFRNVNNTRRLLIQGYAENNFHNGQYLNVKSDSSFIATFQGNGRVGIANARPLHALDVSGDINTTGALRVNGSAGSSGTVLRSNGDGSMSWGNLCQYNNFVTLRSLTTSIWTVPAGVTRIVVELWGAGGGGNVLAAGGGGGYIKAHFTVAPGDAISYTTGDGGPGAVSATAANGTNSNCTVGPVTITAGGAQGALYLTAANGQAGFGGSYSVSGSFINYVGATGTAGGSLERSFWQYNATTYYESGKAGRGGDAGNSNTGATGQTYLYNTTGSALVVRNGNPSGGLVPGGGGASGVQYGATNIAGGSGADGILIIYY